MADWYPIPGNILTRWAKEVTPQTAWREYPRPQMTRSDWKNLNGLWEYGITSNTSTTPEYMGKILVPFPIESALSGVKQSLQTDEQLWYRRSFTVPHTWSGQRILLHFGAVDWEATIWVNGNEVGEHRGGYLPFSFDITSKLVAGGNELVVAVRDPTDKSWGARGKQTLLPKGIWYTAVSGIWQTVWLEPVPETYVQSMKIKPDIDSEHLEVTISVQGDRDDLLVMAIALDGDTQIGVISGLPNEPLRIPLPNPILWHPSKPFLYDLRIEIYKEGKVIDQVGSYFGMRKFSMKPDDKGRLRLCINNKPLFHYGPLDQGYWPDGLYTPPNEDAMRYDLEFLKEIGCNMLRKHIKVEPARYYYDCDRLGIIVWQDMVNGGKPVGSVLSILANVIKRLTRSDNRFYWRVGRTKKTSREDYWYELHELVDHLYNFTCIGMWVPFNEGWGQFDANQVADWLKDYDPTRPVDHASGWFDQGGGDFRSIHTYFKALNPEIPDSERGVILSEFGGYALKLEHHTWNPDTEFGYRKFKSKGALTNAYLDLLESQLKPWIELGLSGAVYTQTTDVEIEINGYLTYDREVAKMDHDLLSEAHKGLINLGSKS
jgi:beta-galactosidase/beta-glucuronidase